MNKSLAIAMSLFITLPGASAATIHVGVHELLPNRAGQTIAIHVAGDDRVAGVNLYAQVGDGGPELAEYGHAAGIDGPAITAVNLKLGTIFSAATSAQDNQTSIPQVAIASVEFSTPGQFTLADGLLAELTIDTTDFFAGSWDLLLDGVLQDFPGGPFDTDFAGLPISIHNGRIHIAAGATGDFNGDGQVSISDVDTLISAIRTQDASPVFDLDQSSFVDLADLTFLVEVLLRTWVGDTNLDGQFNSSDLVRVFLAGQYEDTFLTNSTWATGDWNADGEFGTGDLVAAFQGGGYEQGTRGGAMAVPEPNSFGLLAGMLGSVALLQACRRRV